MLSAFRAVKSFRACKRPLYRFSVAASLLLFLVTFPFSPASAQHPGQGDDSKPKRIVRVGVEQYKPLAFFDETGKAAGLAVEILSAVAAHNSWRLEFVRGSFPELVGKLDRGDIDILPTIAKTPERAGRYQFSINPYISNWGVVYKRRDAGISGLHDLNGQRVAIVSADTHGKALLNLAEKFSFSLNTVPVVGFGAALDALEDDGADAAVISRLYGASLERLPFEIVPTSIVLNPVNLHFAAPLPTDSAVMAGIDEFLERTGDNPDSQYHELINKWIGDPHRTGIPDWVWYVFSTLVAVVLLIAFVTVVSRIQVRRRTCELTAANDELALSERQLDRILNTLVDGLVIVTSDGTVRYANAAAGRYFDTERDALVGKPFGLALPELHNPEASITRSNGASTPIELRSAEIGYQGEQCTLISLRDISERKQAERVLEEKEQFIRATLENTSEGIIVIGVDGSIITVNAAAQRMFGYAAEEIQGRNVAVLMPEPYRSDHDAHIRRYLETGKGKILGVGARELVGRRKDGSEIQIDLAIAEMDTIGQRYFIGAVRDITSRKEYEADLRENERIFRSAFESAGQGVALLSIDGRYLEVNPAFCDITGRSEAELLEIDFKSMTHPDDLPAELEKIDRLLSGELNFYQFEKRSIRKDGTVVPVWVSRSIVRDEDGSPQYFVTQTNDISERRQAEEQLHQAQKMEAVGQLTGGIAHDFNNILSVILGNLQLVQRRVTEDAKMFEQVERAVSATRRGADLTKRLLAFSRRQVLEEETIDPAEMVRELLPLLSRTLGTDIEIESHLDDSLPPITVDVSQLENAVINLCVNARDAMPDGGRLIIELAISDLDEDYARAHGFIVEPGDYVKLTISDSGSGMPEEVRKRIFEPFYTTKENGKGTGLGMAMVYGFVKQSGGYVNVYSEIGAGTTIKIYLPASETGIQTPARRAESSAQDYRGSEHILLVDDDDEVRATLAETLETFGYTITEARDGPAALKCLDGKAAFDILVTDVMMSGGMNGVDVVKSVRARHPEMPAILQSGYSGHMIVPEEILDARTAYLTKPFTDEVFCARLREVLAVVQGSGTRTGT